MKTSFTHLKKLWDLPEDTSIETLLKHATNKLKTDSKPELLYIIAELHRHLDHTSDADYFYKKTIELTNQRSQERAILLEKRIAKKRNETRVKLFLFIFLPIVGSLLIATLIWSELSRPETLPNDSNPEKFAFTQWLAKQQMVEIISTLQAENPELTFDFSRSATAMSPMEFMQSMMQPDALNKLKREQEAKNIKSENEDGRPPFQCSRERPVQCAQHDIPNAPGEQREEVVLLMEAYRSILNTEKDCKKLEESIESIGQQLQWRKSERNIKADLEDLATACFYKQKNIEKTLEHARKLQCSGDIGYINSVYWYTTAINHHAKNEDNSLTAYQCFNEATDYIEKNKLFSPAYIASRHRESGALAWLYFDDLSTATEELKKGRTILKNIPDKTRVMHDVIGEINLDLMETYVTANIDNDEFQELLNEINSSGRLTDGYKQIKDTLASIYFMQNNETKTAQIHLDNLSRRFKLIPEYVCGWDWSGFRRGLKDSISDEKIREQATILVDATNCYIPQSTSKRIKQVQSVSDFLRGR